MLNFNSLLYLAVVCLATPVLLANQTWTDQNGNTMEAVLVDTIERNGETIAVFSKEGIRYQVPLKRLAEDDQQRVLSGSTSSNDVEEATETARERTDFENYALDGLMEYDNGKLVNAGDNKATPAAWYALYFSAGWCPPCRGFTPDLVKFYKRYKRLNPDFEIIFISGDRNEDDMVKYMRDYRMPFATYNYGQIPATVARYRGSGIPCLVFLDKDGTVLADSYDSKGDYLGPRSVL